MTPPPPPRRFRLGHVPIDDVRFDEALGTIASLVDEGRGGTVFTPNVDHIVLAENDSRFRQAYTATRLSLIDGTPVLWACRWLGFEAPEKISGSDLVGPLLAEASRRSWRVFLLGAAEETARRASARLRADLPGLQIVGLESPRIDMNEPPAVRRQVRDRVKAARPDLVLVALGSPKGELWAHESQQALAPAVVIGVGASLDFIAGTARRAPRWMSTAGLEWLYRLLREPRRLWRRYLLRDPVFVSIVLRTWRDRRQADARESVVGTRPAPRRQP